MNGQWTNTSSGHTFQKGKVDFSAVRKDEVTVSYAIPANTMTGYQNLVAVTGTASSTWASTTTCVLGTRSGTTTGNKDWGREGVARSAWRTTMPTTSPSPWSGRPVTSRRSYGTTRRSRTRWMAMRTCGIPREAQRAQPEDQLKGPGGLVRPDCHRAI